MFAYDYPLLSVFWSAATVLSGRRRRTLTLTH
jgi:hypothetical protein